MMNVSIVIPVLNSHEILRRQVQHFYEMELPGDTELIIVDDGSDPPLQCNRLAPVPLKIHHTHDTRPWTWALARNAGARMATGNKLLMFDLDHILTREALDFVRGWTGDKVQFKREFGILDERGFLTQDREVLAAWGLLPRYMKMLKVGPLPNNFAMRRDLYWEMGGYREDLVGRPYPQGEDRYFKNAWHKLRVAGKVEVCEWRPTLYVMPNGQFCGDVDANPFGLFHDLSRKSKKNVYHQRLEKERAGS